MSYDYPDGYVEPKPTWRYRLASPYWRFVLWCALDAESPWLNRWGMRRLGMKDQTR
jgi:hypothetical protein